MVETQEHPHFRVEFFDKWLEINNFITIKVTNEEEARDLFWNRHQDESRYEITDVKHVFDLPEILE